MHQKHNICIHLYTKIIEYAFKKQNMVEKWFCKC